MKRLFSDETDRYNAEGLAVDSATADALQEIFRGWVANGYSIRDIGHVMHAAVTDLELNEILSLQIKEK